MDRTVGRALNSGTQGVYKNIDELAPVYGASALVPYEASVLYNVFAKTVAHEMPRLAMPVLGVWQRKSNMKPAICSVCEKLSDPNNAGDWVEFKDYDKDQATNLSHPKGLEYFCDEHIQSAQDLTHFDSGTALKKLRTIPSNERMTGKAPTPNLS